MNRQTLIARIARETRVSKALASRMVTSALGAITTSLKKGDTVTIVGFGTFKTAVRKARAGRNPLTGGPIMPTMGARLELISGNSKEKRHTGSLIYQVAEGRG